MRDIATLQADLAAAEAAATSARQAAERAQQERLERQQERGEEWDRNFLDRAEAELEQLARDERAAREAFVAAVVGSDIGRTWIAMRSLRWRRMSVSGDAMNTANRRGDSRRFHELAYRDPRLLEDLLDILENAAKNEAAGLDEARADERQSYIEERP